mmetsp:Transcript_33226/g.75065  ORF Transcript_33226/g.75065 Transcript_33226/m.75065 type:complete len:385 (-) Transcript_33226:413-1567(-)
MKTHLEAMAQDDAATLPQLEKVLQEFKVDEASLGSAGVQLFNFAIKCRDEQLFPCLCFQLDSFKCLELYKELLGTLESKQRVEFPNYYKDLEEKAAAERKKAVDAAKAAGSAAKGKKGKDDEDGGGGADEVPDDALLETFIDTAAPHPSYVLSPPTARISTVEFDDILDEMKRDKEPLPPNHPLARGLRRGLGIYIEDVGMTVYRRVVQRLAQQGKLAVVFSDHSLAYGVNMPFRTCAFCGDMGGLLTPLMAQQMSGRTGRRGLDTQGNIVYLGMPWGDIKGLIRGRIPAIEGEKQVRQQQGPRHGRHGNWNYSRTVGEKARQRRSLGYCRPPNVPVHFTPRAFYYEQKTTLQCRVARGRLLPMGGTASATVKGPLRPEQQGAR